MMFIDVISNIFGRETEALNNHSKSESVSVPVMVTSTGYKPCGASSR